MESTIQLRLRHSYLPERRDMASEETLGKALSLEGPLKKKSPNSLIGYQKRYFAVRDDGKLLAYYRKKPVTLT